MKWIALLILQFIFSTAYSAEVSPLEVISAECKFLEEWQNLKNDYQKQLVNKTSSPIRISHLQIEIFKSKMRVSKEFFKLYYSGRLPKRVLNICFLTQADRNDFLESVTEVFFNESLNLLKKSDIPILKLLVSEVQKKNKAREMIAFSLSHHVGPRVDMNSHHQPSASFYHETKSIYANIDEIPPHEWLIHFCHELLHFLDQDRFDYANAIFAEEKRDHHFSNLARSITQPENLGEENQKRFYEWMTAALDRGFLGEYRAWTITLIIYEKGKKNTSAEVTGDDSSASFLWPRIKWIEDWLAKRKQDQPIQSFVVETLDPKFLDPDPNDPSSEEFSLPLFRNQLAIIRNNVRSQIQPLYDLNIFLEKDDQFPTHCKLPHWMSRLCF